MNIQRTINFIVGGIVGYLIGKHFHVSDSSQQA